MDVPRHDACTYVFASYQLDTVRRVLTRHGAAVELTPRLFDLLTYLVQHHERVVGRDELAQAIWGGRSMADANLPVAMSALRKMLPGDGAGQSLILTVPGQGFQLAAPVEVIPVAQSFMSQRLADIPAQDDPDAAGAPVPRRPAGRHLTLLAAAGVFLIAAAVAWQALPGAGRGGTAAAVFTPPPHSIAVLPFMNGSGDPEQDYFSDGISEQLINALGQIGALQVVARTSSFSFKGTATPVVEIARRLNVGAVLEGNVRRDAGRLRLQARLIDGVSGKSIWSQDFDEDQGNILGVQGRLAEAVIRSLRVALAGPDAARLTLGGTTNAAALDADLRAVSTRLTFYKSEAAWHQTLNSLNNAIELDPNFALAFAHRSQMEWSYAVRTLIRDQAYLRSLKEAAIADAKRAIALAPKLAAGHAALGFALGGFGLDLRRQEAEFVRAHELAPGDSSIATAFSRFEIFAGHVDTALAAARQAVALDPLRREAYSNLAVTSYYARRPADALVALDHARALGSPNTIETAAFTGYSELSLGKPQAARAACKDETRWEINLCLAVAYHALGDQANAAAQLQKIKLQAGETAGYGFALLYAQWGDTAQALAYLQRAFDLHDYGLIEMKVDPMLDPVRQTPQFQDIERRLDFPP